MIYFRFYLTIFLFSVHCLIYSQGKYITILNCRIYNNSSFSASYVKYSNWRYQYSNVALNLKEQLNCDSIFSNGVGNHSRFYAELGFTKIIDSVWYTSADIWEIQYNRNIKEAFKKWNTSYSMYLSSQFLSSYETTKSSTPGESSKQWQAGFFNPMLLEVYYGKTFSFWKICRINFSLAQIRITTEQMNVQGSKLINDNQLFIIDEKTIVKSEYGFGIQTNIRKKINDHFRWENFSRFFGNAINPGRISFDFKNSFIVNPVKHLMICFNTRLLYKPTIKPYKVQQKYELLIGIEF